MTNFSTTWDEMVKKLIEHQTKAITQAASQVYKETVDRTPFGRPELWRSGKAPVGYKPGDLRKAWEVDWGRGFIHATASFSGKLTSVKGATQYKFGDDITIRNQKDYAKRVEFGWSRQAPQGMMRISVNMYQSFLDKAIKNNKL